MARLSVAMCNYNHAKSIGRAIDAIISQSRPPDQFVIVDDGSTDNSIDVIESYCRRCSFIHLERLPANTRAVGAIKRVLELVDGDYLYSAAADDYILPGFFQESMSLLEKFPEAGLCCSDPYIEENGKRTLYPQKLVNESGYLPPGRLVDIMRSRRVWIAGNSCVVKRSAQDSAGGYDVDLKWHCDWFILLVMAFREGLCYVPKGFAVNVVSDGQYSAVGQRDPVQQNGVLGHMLDVLRSPSYRTVLPLFQQSGCLSVFWRPWYAPELLRAICSSSRHWNSETLKLIRIPIFWGMGDCLRYCFRIPSRIGAAMKRAIWKPVPENIKQRYKAHKDTKVGER